MSFSKYLLCSNLYQVLASPTTNLKFRFHIPETDHLGSQLTGGKFLDTFDKVVQKTTPIFDIQHTDQLSSQPFGVTNRQFESLRKNCGKELLFNLL